MTNKESVERIDKALQSVECVTARAWADKAIFIEEGRGGFVVKMASVWDKDGAPLPPATIDLMPFGDRESAEEYRARAAKIMEFAIRCAIFHGKKLQREGANS